MSRQIINTRDRRVSVHLTLPIELVDELDGIRLKCKKKNRSELYEILLRDSLENLEKLKWKIFDQQT